MENKLSCDVIMDLLPSYADGICSEETKKIVEEHLVSCKACQASYNAMKQDEEISGLPDLKADSPAMAKNTARTASPKISSASGIKIDEQEIMKKVNRKMHQRMLTNAIIGIVVGAIILTLAIIFFKPGRTLASADYLVTYENMDLSELAEHSFQTYFDYHRIPQNSILVFEDGKSLDDCLFILVSVPGYSNAKVAVDKEYLSKNPQICLVTIYSHYAISEYRDEVKEEDGKNILYVDHVKTPIFGSGQSSDWISVTTIEMCHIDDVNA